MRLLSLIPLPVIRPVGLLLVSFFLIFALSANAQKDANTSAPKTDDEFVGPFASWLNAKTMFHAAGDGITDDSEALQRALNAACGGVDNPTLYLPAGTYLIKRTLILNYHINISVIGANPKNTIIKWGGAARGTMMQINGTAYSRFDRITFNGSGLAEVAIEQSWDGARPHFDSSNQYADDTFIDVGFGIRGGSLGHGFAETTILRDRFIHNTSAGVSLGNFNALDVWIRNSVFDNCAIGVTNIYGAGNFRLYDNIFRNSATSDISINNTGGFSVRGNTSNHSKKFFYAGGSSNPATTIIEGNTIIDPYDTQAITIGNQGPTIFRGNIIRSRPDATEGPVAKFSCWSQASTLSAGNTFTVANPVSIDGQQIQYNDHITARVNLKYLAEQTIPGTQPSVNRQIFEVPRGADAAIIQSVINKAAKLSGNRPVVHFSYGNYKISSTLYLPEGTDIQIVGDGYGDQYGTSLIWSANQPGTVIVIKGPSKATLRDLTIRGTPGTINLLVTNADQKGSRVFLQEFKQAGGSAGLKVNGLDHTLVFGFDVQFSGLQKAVEVIGGRQAKAGNPAEGRTILYSGAESNNTLSHSLSGGGNLTVQDTWYEGSTKTTYAELSGGGFFAAYGDLISTPKNTQLAAVNIHDFSGKAIFSGDDCTDHIAITGNCSGAKILVLGMMAEDSPLIATTTPAPGADLRVWLSRARDDKKSSSHPMADIGKYSQAFLADMLLRMNVKPIVAQGLPAGITDIRLYRVMSLGGAMGLVIQAGATQPSF